jgi:hypothetical protein
MVEAHGARGIFQRSGEFPNGTDTEYSVAPAAIDFYKNGSDRSAGDSNSDRLPVGSASGRVGVCSIGMLSSRL